jgi:hypothetical protein
MRFLLGWTIKLAIIGGLYFAVSSGALHVKLPDTVLGFRVPPEAQQFVDRTAKIAEYGQQTTSGFKHIAEVLK